MIKKLDNYLEKEDNKFVVIENALERIIDSGDENLIEI